MIHDELLDSIICEYEYLLREKTEGRQGKREVYALMLYRRVQSFEWE